MGQCIPSCIHSLVPDNSYPIILKHFLCSICSLLSFRDNMKHTLDLLFLFLSYHLFHIFFLSLYATFMSISFDFFSNILIHFSAVFSLQLNLCIKFLILVIAIST